MYSYQYPRPALTADIAVFSSNRKKILLIRRKNDPFKNCWAFPGGFFDMDDADIEHTAQRELEEETGLGGLCLTLQLIASRKDRDPRGRTVTAVFATTVDPSKVKPEGGDDAAETRWFDLNQLPPLAFDHGEILSKITEQIQ